MQLYGWISERSTSGSWNDKSDAVSSRGRHLNRRIIRLCPEIFTSVQEVFHVAPSRNQWQIPRNCAIRKNFACTDGLIFPVVAHTDRQRTPEDP